MPIASWELVRNRPAIRLSIVDPTTGRTHPRILLADTGAGTKSAPFEVLMDEDDCLLFADRPGEMFRLTGAYSGNFRAYFLLLRVDEFDLVREISAIGVEHTPAGFDGIAGFRFLRRFTYGNFGDADRFGLSTG